MKTFSNMSTPLLRITQKAYIKLFNELEKNINDLLSKQPLSTGEVIEAQIMNEEIETIKELLIEIKKILP